MGENMNPAILRNLTISELALEAERNGSDLVMELMDRLEFLDANYVDQTELAEANEALEDLQQEADDLGIELKNLRDVMESALGFLKENDTKSAIECLEKE